MKLTQSLWPLIYFPTNIVFLDDDTEFLENLTMLFEDKKFNAGLHSFDDPDIAKEYISKSPGSVGQLCVSFKSKHLENRNFDLINHFSAVKDEFKQNDIVSLVVVDYAMPARDGVAFAKEIRASFPDVKILMLTGEADETIAIKAFNEGVIDLFVKKEMDNVGKVLITSAQKLFLQYFLDQTNIALNNLNPNDPTGLPNWVSIPEAVGFLFEQYPITEIKSIAILNELGVFHLKTKTGLEHYFALAIESEYEAFLEVLSDFVSEDDSIYEDAVAHKAIPILFDADNIVPFKVKTLNFGQSDFYLIKEDT